MLAIIFSIGVDIFFCNNISQTQNIATNFVFLNNEKYKTLIVLNDVNSEISQFDPELAALLKQIIFYTAILVLLGFSLVAILNLCNNAGLFGGITTDEPIITSKLDKLLLNDDKFLSDVFSGYVSRQPVKGSNFKSEVCTQVVPEHINYAMEHSGNFKCLEPTLVCTCPLENNVVSNLSNVFYLFGQEVIKFDQIAFVEQFLDAFL